MSVDDKDWQHKSLSYDNNNNNNNNTAASTTATVDTAEKTGTTESDATAATSGTSSSSSVPEASGSLPSAELALDKTAVSEEVEVVVVSDNKKESAAAADALPSSSEAEVFRIQLQEQQDDSLSNLKRETAVVQQQPAPNSNAAATLVKNTSTATNNKNNNNNANTATTTTVNTTMTDGTIDHYNHHNNSITTTTTTTSTPSSADALRASTATTGIKEWGVVTLEVQEIVGNVCVVFPSAITFPAEAAAATTTPTTRPELTNGHVPYVTLHQSFGKKKGNGNMVKALENLFRAVTSTPAHHPNQHHSHQPQQLLQSTTTTAPGLPFLASDFLADDLFGEDPCDAMEKNCLQRLRVLLQRANEQKSTVLLFLILLLRIEVAVYLGFRKALHDRTEPQQQQQPHQYFHHNYHHQPQPQQHHHQNAHHNPHNHNYNRNIPDDSTMTMERLDTDKLLSLVGHVERLAMVANSIDKSKLSYLMGPLVHSGHCSMGGNRHTKATNAQQQQQQQQQAADSNKIQNLLLTPLPSLIRMFRTAEATNRTVFFNWDRSWCNALRRVAEFASSYPTPTAAPSIVTAHNNINNNNTNGGSNNNNHHNLEQQQQQLQTPSHQDSNTDWMDTTPSSVATAGSGAKKNKKRRKRKKNKKSIANNTNNDESEQPATPNQNGKSPAAASDGTQVEESDEATAAATPTTTATTTKHHSKKKAHDASHHHQHHHHHHHHHKKDGPAEGNNVVKTPKNNNSSTSTSVVSPASASLAGKNDKEVTDEDKTANNNKAAPSQPPVSTFEKTASRQSEKHDDDETSEADSNKVGGQATVAVVTPVSGQAATASEATTSVAAEGQAAEGSPKTESVDQNNDEWETVVVAKGRGNRKKSGRASNQSPASANNPAHQSFHHQNQNNNGPKKTKSKRSKESRKRVANGKMVREILSSVLDSVDDEVRRRKQQPQQGRVVNKNALVAKAPPTSAWKDASRKPIIAAASVTPTAAALAGKKEPPVRDAGVGERSAAAVNKTPSPPTATKAEAGSAAKTVTPQSSTQTPTASSKRGQQKHVAGSPSKGSRGTTLGADQNTASTIPETVSAVSDPRRTAPSNKDVDITRSDSSSTETDDIRKQDQAAAPSKKTASPAPPLPTLLSPGNANSASSSVASSLEAPHASHGRHHTSTSKEADVGYHLLDVCDRLTRDMHNFMAHRASALSTRRRERGALLAALQDSVAAIWAGHSHVELYGSCATMLDLPSSDLDVVVCGLDHIDRGMVNLPSPQQQNDMGPDARKMDRQQMGHRQHHMQQYMPPMQMNSDRVVALAAELERQPWAVHVKAIPTASVPVVKVLADPSRLPGATPQHALDGEEWMMPQQHQGGHQDIPPMGATAHFGDSPQAMPPHPSGQQFDAQMKPPVWRGADVINGLLKLDITFEGPEHGGIGSTEFSRGVIQNVCDETGLPPESTAFVQVVLVVKELLAQRRLNEPFSGGLSSYALLLLVLAVMCERKVIQEELERVERQRRAVAAGGGNSEIAAVGSTDAMQAQSMFLQQEGAELETNTPAAKPNTVVTSTPDKTDAVSDKDNISPAKSLPKAKQQRPQQQTQEQAERRAQGGGNVQKVRPTAASFSPASEKEQAKSPGNSWASIAMGKNNNEASDQGADNQRQQDQEQKKSPKLNKPSSFADAVARNAGVTPPAKKAEIPPSTKAQGAATSSTVTQSKQSNDLPKKGANANEAGKKSKQKEQHKQQNGPTTGEDQTNKRLQQKAATMKKSTESVASAKQQSRDGGSKATTTMHTEPERKIEADEKTSKFNNYSSEHVESNVISANQSLFPQGFNDIIEVLCSGETTPGKLLMHVLLFYGQHFDAHATAIDISGKHHREIPTHVPPYTHLSPYLQRRSAGSIDPVTGMYTVDPIVVYDPLEGAENNNVARRCFLWTSVKWVFAQAYMTLSNAVERNTTPPGSPTKNDTSSATSATTNAQQASNGEAEEAAWNGPYNASDKENFFDPSSPLLDLLISFK